MIRYVFVLAAMFSNGIYAMNYAEYQAIAANRFAARRYLVGYMHVDLIKEGHEFIVKDILDNNRGGANRLKELFAICNDPENLRAAMYCATNEKNCSLFLKRYKMGNTYPVYSEVKEYDRLVIELGISEHTTVNLSVFGKNELDEYFELGGYCELEESPEYGEDYRWM